MRLVDADEAYKVLTDYYHHRTEIRHKALKEAIGRVPSVDAVEVIRCKDCKWHRTGEFYALGNDRVPYETISECLKWHDDVPVDFYCAWGERRKDERK